VVLIQTLVRGFYWAEFLQILPEVLRFSDIPEFPVEVCFYGMFWFPGNFCQGIQQYGAFYEVLVHWRFFMKCGRFKERLQLTVLSRLFCPPGVAPSDGSFPRRLLCPCRTRVILEPFRSLGILCAPVFGPYGLWLCSWLLGRSPGREPLHTRHPRPLG